MKKLAIPLVLFLALALSGTAIAASKVVVYLNGEPLSTQVKIIDGKVYLPLREIGQALKIDVDFVDGKVLIKQNKNLKVTAKTQAEILAGNEKAKKADKERKESNELWLKQRAAEQERVKNAEIARKQQEKNKEANRLELQQELEKIRLEQEQIQQHKIQQKVYQK